LVDGMILPLAALLQTASPQPLPQPPATSGEQVCPDGRQVPAAELCPALIFFDSGKSELSREAQSELDELAGRLRSNPSISLRLVGHSDREGPAAANRRVALRRAELVAEALRARGLQLPLLAESAGEDRPLVPTPDGVREPQNRRVEIIFERR
jgi:outer membrane protein OmpA-like peptidoglycan-associated protein